MWAIWLKLKKKFVQLCKTLIVFVNLKKIEKMFTYVYCKYVNKNADEYEIIKYLLKTKKNDLKSRVFW